MSIPAKKRFSVKQLTITSMMIAVTVVLMITPLGTIRLPVVSVTIAHVPAIISAILLGYAEGFAVAAAFGISSLIVAVVSPSSLLDPFFVNPLISVLPRVLIPLTARYTYKGLSKVLSRLRNKPLTATLSVAVGVVVGNLTNTFGVYTMLYLVYAKQILDKSGTPALQLIIAAISTTTALKCVIVMVLCTPVILGLRKALRFSQ